MSTPLLQPLTVLQVSREGRPLTGDGPIDTVDPAIDAVITDSVGEAVDRLAANRPGERGIDAVVCVHDPPQIDALRFLDHVGALRPEVPVIVVPGTGNRDCTEAALAAGATDVVQTSPSSLSPAVLANRIRQFVRTDDATERHQDPGSATETSESDSPTGISPEVPAVRLNDAVRAIHQAGRTDTVADVVADVTADLLDAPGVGVFLFDDGDNLLRPAAITETMTDYYGGETVFGPGKPDSITWQVFVTGDSLLFDDLRTSDVRVNADTDARSGVFAPVGEHGVLVASSAVVGAFSEASRQVVELLAAAAEATLDRVESTAARRRGDRRFQELENRLEYVERTVDLLRSADRSIVAEETRENLETAVLDAVVGAGEFAFAWIGGVDAETGRLTPREWTDGGRQYLDELSLDVEDCDEPSCRAARRWETVVEPNVAENLDSGGWERDALSRNFHSALSVPLTYDGVLYGVLTVYADSPDAFTEPLASCLERIGETTAFAVNASERKFSMLSDGVTELELRIDGADDVLNVVAEAVGATIECFDLAPRADGSTELTFAASDVSAEAVLSATAGLVAVDGVTHVAGGDAHLFRAAVSGDLVGSVIATSGGVPREIVADEASLVATVNVPDAVDARTFVNRLERRYPGTEILSRRERDRSAMSRSGFLTELESALTDRQLEVLRTAHRAGFFRSPRDATGQDVADELGVSQPTISHHLRAGQGTLFSLLFGEE